MIRRIILFAATLAMAVSFSITSASALTFSDVPKSAWYYDTVSSMTAQGVLNGYEDQTFRPENTITRGEFIKMCLAATGQKVSGATGSNWWRPYVTRANYLNILNGELAFRSIEGEFGSEPITREEMASVIELCDENLLGETMEIDQDILSVYKKVFSDYSDIDVTYRPLVVQGYGHGLVAGMDATTFSPKSTATRAQAATMAARLMDYSKRNTDIAGGAFGDEYYGDDEDSYEDGSVPTLDDEPDSFLQMISALPWVTFINHRGHSAEAPENTFAAFELSANWGYTHVETDISFTSDGVPVLIHDDTINRTSNGKGSVNSMSYTQLRQYEYGSWYNSDYEGERIPALREFLIQCKSLGLRPYLEFKAYNSKNALPEDKIKKCIDIVKECGMLDQVTWISFDKENLKNVIKADSGARVGYLSYCDGDNPLAVCKELRNLGGNAFLDASISGVNVSLISQFKSAGIPIEVWTLDNKKEIYALDPYITGVSTNI